MIILYFSVGIMKISDYYFVIISRFLHTTLNKNLDGAKFSAILYLSVITTNTILDIILFVLYCKISTWKLVEPYDGVKYAWGVLTIAILYYYYRYYSSKRCFEDMEKRYLCLSKVKRRWLVVTLLIWSIGTFILLLVFRDRMYS